MAASEAVDKVRVRRRAAFAATIPLLLVLLGTAALKLVCVTESLAIGEAPKLDQIPLAVLGIGALSSLGPLAGFEGIYELVPWGAIILPFLGWTVWILLILKTRLGDLPAPVHLIATGLWLAAGIVSFFALASRHMGIF